MTAGLHETRGLPADFQFSQSSLQDYVDCARRFELRYLHQLRYPAIEAEPLIEHERHMKLGDDFHRLVHQHQSGVPESLLSHTIQDDTLRTWWTRYLQHGNSDLPSERYAETTLMTHIDQFRLIAKYDLLAIEPGQKLVIVDWKTSPQQPSRMRLEQRLQTIVYLYILVEAGRTLNGGQPVEPEQVELWYWFATNPEHPVKFNYDHQQHQRAGETLRRLTGEVATRTVFKLTDDVTRCKFCVYRSLCNRGITAGQWSDEMTPAEESVDREADALTFDFDQIAEVEF